MEDIVQHQQNGECHHQDMRCYADVNAEQVRDAQEPEIFCNFSNGYGRDLEQAEENAPETEQAKSDRIDIGLMIASSALCLGIIGIMIYWCVRFLG